MSGSEPFSVTDQSSVDDAHIPSHVAIIMDGNGRWAERRGLPRSAGHKQGVEAVRNAVRTAGELGIKTLTLFSFSSENWSRPEAEVSYLMGLLKRFIKRDLADLHKEGVRVSVIGARENLPSDILPLIEDAERLTQHNTRTRLVVAFNYGGRDELARAARRLAEQAVAGEITTDQIDETLLGEGLDTADWSDPDLLIRTSGEQRISNFLLWQLAYTEFVFADCLWPDFNRQEFKKALAVFNIRDRRYGGVPRKVAAQ